MKTSGLLQVCGSIRKRESIAPVSFNILLNTSVAEANLPYSAYYGELPEHVDPNSLFLFTSQAYSLEEVLRFAHSAESCFGQTVNFASAIVNFGYHEYNAIRVKYFPNYEDIHLLQRCCLSEGARFSKKVILSDFAIISVNKCFDLEELDTGIYMDKIELHKGYITLPAQLSQGDFEKILVVIRNNSACKLFDAACGSFIINNEIKEIVRIYAENIDFGMLKCIKKKFAKAMMNFHLVSA